MVLNSEQVFAKAKTSKKNSVFSASFYSEYLGVDRVFSIALPKNYDSSNKYPVIYVLDGDYLFDYTVGQVRMNSYWDKYPESIVVGISHGDNRKELGISDPGDGFFQFFTKELVDFVNGKYSSSGFNVLVSHSFSGRFSNQVLLYRPNLFNAFVNVSPAIKNELLLKVDSSLHENKDNVFYYLCTSSQDLREHSRLAFNVRDKFRFRRSERFHFKFEYLEDKTHVTMLSEGISNGLDFIFKLYQESDWKELEGLVANEVDVVRYVDIKYKEIKNIYGLELPVRQNEHFAISDYFFKTKKYDQALSYGENLSKEKSSLSYIGEQIQGEVFEMKKDYINALVHYKKMVELLPEETVNKEDFISDVKRMSSKLMEE